MLQTFRDLDELREAMLAARESAGDEMTVVAHVSVEDDATLASGAAVHEFHLDRWPADVIGVNCSIGPKSVLRALEQMCYWTKKPLSAMPSAGLPAEVNGRMVYPCSPEYMAQYVHRFLRTRTRIIGGCCGTTPEHIRAIRAAMGEAHVPESEIEFGPRAAAVSVAVEDQPAEAGAPPDPLAERSGLGAKLAAGTFISMVEIAPPRSADASNEVAAAAECRNAGIDAATIPDGLPGRMSALALSQLIRQQSNKRKPSLDCVLHLQGDGGSVSAIEATLLGAQALGIRDLLCAGAAEHSIAVAGVAARLRLGLVGFEVDPFALDIDAELRRIELLMKTGAAYAVSRPVFDIGLFEAFQRRIEPLELPLIAGIAPLASFHEAEYFINELRIPVPAASVARMSVAQLKERTQGEEVTFAEGTAIARETIEGLRGMAAGIRVSAPRNRHRVAIEIAEAARSQAQV